MTVLTVKNVSKSFGVDEVLSDVSFSLNDTARLGLVGPNGAGKTTMLRIITGEMDASSGSISIPSGLRVGYLKQEENVHSKATVWDYLLHVYDEVFALEEKMRRLEHEMEAAADDPDRWDKISHEYERVTAEFEERGGFRYESAIKGVLAGLGLGEDVYARTVDTLSGGQKSRLGLAKLLLETPDVLLLDEPTNHLDMNAIAWLEGYLKVWNGAVVIVSHDRWFLDQLCGEIVEIYGGIAQRYKGNYTEFIQQRETKREQMAAEYERNKKEIGRYKQMIERYKVWGRMGGGKNFIKAAAKQRELDRLQRATRPDSKRATMKLKLSAGGRGGNDVLVAENLAMAFDKPLFSGLNIQLVKGDKAALIGANGIGKTTLLKIIAGRLTPTEGEVRLGAGIEMKYYDQMQENLDAKLTAFEQMREAFPEMDDGEIRNMLAGFLFFGDDVFKKIEKLSGGEKGRLSLLMLMIGQGNLLVLDEPTNHLDMDSREILEDAILDFEGTVLFVSHDRYFINKLCSRVLEMKEDGVMQHSGNWCDYLAFLEKQKCDVQHPDTGMTKTEMAKQQRAKRDEEKRLREAKKHVKQVESNIEAAEARLDEIEQALANPANLSDDELAALSVDHAQALDEIERLMTQWEAAHEAAQ